MNLGGTSEASGNFAADAHELRRQVRVLTSGVLGLAGNGELTRIIEEAAAEVGFPFAAISVVDRTRLWLAVAYGFDPREFARPHSFCDAAISIPDRSPLRVVDAWKEPRFRFAPAVLEMGVRAYYAAPLLTQDGYALGTLCLLDQEPRWEVSDADMAKLVDLAGEASSVIAMRCNARALADSVIAELCVRLDKAIAENDEVAIETLDLEIRRLDTTDPEEWN